MADERLTDAGLGAAARTLDGQPFMPLLGASLTVLGYGRCRIALPWRADLTQQHGYVHAGVLGAIADTAAGYAVFTTLDDADTQLITVGFTFNFVAPARGDSMVADAEVLKSGRTLSVCRMLVYAVRQMQQTVIATGQQTLIRLPSAVRTP